MQAKDIPDDVFLEAVNTTSMLRHGRVDAGASRWDLVYVLGGHPEWIGTEIEVESPPEKVVLAKARKLIRRGRLSGCPCGCRGSFVVTVDTPT